MKNLILFLGFFLCLGTLKSQIFKAKDGATTVTFFSESPLENIEATNKGAIIVLNSTTNDIQIRVTIENFKFKNSLMGEHFNENYMETEKKGPKDAATGAVTYPNRNAVFKGKINEKIDYNTEGENKVTVTGKMDMHGVSRDVTISGTVKKVGNELILYSKFPIKVVDYDIKVPTMYVKNIAETVEVTINSTLEPYQKK
jgi:hypothetical protein